MQTIPVKETREKLADLINDVYVGKKSYIITKFGKPRAMLSPISNVPKKKKVSGIAKSFGMWKDRTDIKDTRTWVSNLREKMSLRRD